MFDLLVLLLTIPIGFLIAYLARDELITGRRYIEMLLLIAFALMIFVNATVIALSLGFIVIVSFISVLKSYDKRWAIVRKT